MNDLLRKTALFFIEAYNELKKVTWLTRKEAIGSTIVVVILVCLVAVFVGFTDLVLSQILAILL